MQSVLKPNTKIQQREDEEEEQVSQPDYEIKDLEYDDEEDSEPFNYLFEPINNLQFTN